MLFSSTRSASALSVWSIIVQQVPGSFETPALSKELGTSGRILRVTIGVATLFFTSYYQTMQLSSLLTSSSRPIEYTLHMLADDLQTGHVRNLLVLNADPAIKEELKNNNNTRPGWAAPLNSKVWYISVINWATKSAFPVKDDTR
jgi:hypothetical protein